MSDTLVLCYHAVSDAFPAKLSVTPDALEHQLRALLRRGYRGTTFTRSVTAPTSGRTLVVTFDDAYRSVLDLAFPVLERLGIPGTVFAPTAYIGADEPMSWPGIESWLETEHRDELLPMSWDDLRRLATDGWEVGSHSCTHPHLTRLTDDQTLERELVDSKAACERQLGIPCTSIAYPYGAVDDRVVAACAQAGYTAAADLPRRAHAGDPLRVPRVGVYHRDDLRRLRLKTARPARVLRASPAWDLADRVRSISPKN